VKVLLVLLVRLFVPSTEGIGVGPSAHAQAVPEDRQHHDEEHRDDDAHGFFRHILSSLLFLLKAGSL
jgi:hypothetical protein